MITSRRGKKQVKMKFQWTLFPLCQRRIYLSSGFKRFVAEIAAANIGWILLFAKQCFMVSCSVKLAHLSTFSENVIWYH